MTDRFFFKFILFSSVFTACLGSASLQAAEHTVEIVTDSEQGLVYFKPKNLKIKKGDTVHWVNTVADLHNVVTYPDGYPEGASGFVSPILTEKGAVWSHVFTESGSYQYHCIPHIFMGMRGTITVDYSTRPEDFHVPTPSELVFYRGKLLEFFDSEDFSAMPEVVTRNIDKE